MTRNVELLEASLYFRGEESERHGPVLLRRHLFLINSECFENLMCVQSLISTDVEFQKRSLCFWWKGRYFDVIMLCSIENIEGLHNLRSIKESIAVLVEQRQLLPVFAISTVTKGITVFRCKQV